MILKGIILTTTIALSLAFIGCGVSVSSSTNNGGTPQKSIVVVAVDGILNGSSVGIDNNADGELQSNEVLTITNAAGKATVTIPKSSSGKIIISSGIDMAINRPFFGSLEADVPETDENQWIVSPLTTLISKGMPDNRVRNVLNIPVGLDLKRIDPNTNFNLLKAGTLVHSIAATIAKSLPNQSFKSVYAQLAQATTFDQAAVSNAIGALTTSIQHANQIGAVAGNINTEMRKAISLDEIKTKQERFYQEPPVPTTPSSNISDFTFYTLPKQVVISDAVITTNSVLALSTTQRTSPYDPLSNRSFHIDWFSTNGALLESKTVVSNGCSSKSNVVPTKDGGILASCTLNETSSVSSSVQGTHALYLVKFSSNRQKMWELVLDTAEIDQSGKFLELSDGTIVGYVNRYRLGTGILAGNIKTNCMLYRISSTGQILNSALSQGAEPNAQTGSLNSLSSCLDITLLNSGEFLISRNRFSQPQEFGFQKYTINLALSEDFVSVPNPQFNQSNQGTFGFNFETVVRSPEIHTYSVKGNFAGGDINELEWSLDQLNSSLSPMRPTSYFKSTNPPHLTNPYRTWSLGGSSKWYQVNPTDKFSVVFASTMQTLFTTPVLGTVDLLSPIERSLYVRKLTGPYKRWEFTFEKLNADFEHVVSSDQLFLFYLDRNHSTEQHTLKLKIAQLPQEIPIPTEPSCQSNCEPIIPVGLLPGSSLQPTEPTTPGHTICLPVDAICPNCCGGGPALDDPRLRTPIN